MIDPMHNLFLGTAKRVFSKWIENGIVSKEGLEKIQKSIQEISSLSDIGRIQIQLWWVHCCSMEELCSPVFNVFS